MNKALSAIIVIAIFWLTGCASTRLVDSQVNSFAPHTVPVGSHYRFERLPSQQADAAGQQRLEELAEQALAQVGLVRDDHNATYSVQISASQRVQNPAQERPLLGWHLGWRIGHGSVALGHAPLFPGLDNQTSYWREVALIMRERHTQVVVYETRASHEGPWSDSEAVWPAMLQAALQGFPTPPAGPRNVNIEIPR